MFKVAFITVGSMDEGRKIAKKLVEEKLAACVNIINGLESIFLWKGKIEEAREVLLIVKTKADKIESLVKRVRELHSYEVPEIIWFDLEGGLKSYLDWIEESLK
ncbi:MAG: divalent-cation tolerance protein CutA [Candidatus Methanomethyliaceae archaeon]|nr:divalent-cation tolerance protein CutA [Candidatus Methanomethyliaceae archaeon]MCX8169826.1 divalent-cation tolerance protein CutA [Candidatus Methanomethyliaceae archaeon]MDW7971161.1 divalent-cation tolerance protein CutA [Nitrososphaerota archaeon]